MIKDLIFEVFVKLVLNTLFEKLFVNKNLRETNVFVCF